MTNMTKAQFWQIGKCEKLTFLCIITVIQRAGLEKPSYLMNDRLKLPYRFAYSVIPAEQVCWSLCKGSNLKLPVEILQI